MGRKVKTVNLVVDTFGNYLGMDRGCISLIDKEKRVQKYPLFESEIGEVVLTSGNKVSTGALSALGFWGIDVLIATRNGRPIAILKNLSDDSHVKTRISQYEALKNGKGIDVAKQIVTAKILSQNQILKKYGLRQHDVMRAKTEIGEMGITDLNELRERYGFDDLDLAVLVGSKISVTKIPGMFESSTVKEDWHRYIKKLCKQD